MKEIYLDYAATTPADRDVVNAAMPYFSQVYYNPASAHALGSRAAKAVELAREQCACAINAAPREIYFTSGGTEAINWAIGHTDMCGKRRIAVSAIEHDAVLMCAESLRGQGYAIDVIPCGADGIVTPDALKSVLSEDCGLVCVMTVNNQTGAVMPVKELAKASHEAGALFFTDGVQSVNELAVDVKEWGVDMFCASSHKFYSIKGGGFLYVRQGVKLTPFMLGGEQEAGLRAGTVNVPAAVAMGAAITKATDEREQNIRHISRVRDAFLSELRYGAPIIPPDRTEGIVTVVFDGINGGRLAVALSLAGVCCSVGSACSAGSATPPHTLVAMGVDGADRAVRFSFGTPTTEEMAAAAAKKVNAVVKRFL